MGPSITVLCATKGRRFLEVMIASHWATAQPGDRLLIFGDGVGPPCPIPTWAEFHSMPKATEGICGHLHLFNALREGVPGDFIALMGDDDVWTPEAFHLFRHVLKRGGERIEAMWYPTTRGMVKAGGGRLLFKNKPPFPPFGPGHRSDGEFYEAVAENQHAGKMVDLVMLGRACFLTQAEWRKLGLEEMYPWKPWFETTRSREDEWPSGKPPGFQSVPKR